LHASIIGSTGLARSARVEVPTASYQEEAMAEANEDLKAKMREALERKNSREKGVHQDRPVQEKAHGPEVAEGAAPKIHRRKAGGGGS
jgi:uncharacterized protein DUF5302